MKFYNVVWFQTVIIFITLARLKTNQHCPCLLYASYFIKNRWTSIGSLNEPVCVRLIDLNLKLSLFNLIKSNQHIAIKPNGLTLIRIRFFLFSLFRKKVQTIELRLMSIWCFKTAHASSGKCCLAAHPVSGRSVTLQFIIDWVYLHYLPFTSPLSTIIIFESSNTPQYYTVHHHCLHRPAALLFPHMNPCNMLNTGHSLFVTCPA